MFFQVLSGAGKGTRTLDLKLGKLSLYQLSYTRAQIKLEKLTAFTRDFCGICNGFAS